MSDDAVPIPLDEQHAPDLGQFIKLCAERYAHSIGERRASLRADGGYRRVRPQDWRAWDEAVSRWQLARRDTFLHQTVAEAPAPQSESVLEIDTVGDWTR